MERDGKLRLVGRDGLLAKLHRNKFDVRLQVRVDRRLGVPRLRGPRSLRR